MGTPSNGSILSQTPPNNAASMHEMLRKHNPTIVTAGQGIERRINHKTTMNGEKLT